MSVFAATRTQRIMFPAALGRPDVCRRRNAAGTEVMQGRVQPGDRPFDADLLAAIGDRYKADDKEDNRLHSRWHGAPREWRGYVTPVACVCGGDHRARDRRTGERDRDTGCGLHRRARAAATSHNERPRQHSQKERLCATAHESLLGVGCYVLVHETASYMPESRIPSDFRRCF